MVSTEQIAGDAVIRPQRSDELAAVVAVVGEAFGRPIVADLVTRLQARAQGPAGISLVAELDGDIVGLLPAFRFRGRASARLHQAVAANPRGSVSSRGAARLGAVDDRRFRIRRRLLRSGLCRATHVRQLTTGPGTLRHTNPGLDRHPQFPR